MYGTYDLHAITGGQRKGSSFYSFSKLPENHIETIFFPALSFSFAANVAGDMFVNSIAIIIEVQENTE